MIDPTLIAAGFGVGAVKAIAGGGPLLTLAALTAAGIDPRVASLTSTVALCPGANHRRVAITPWSRCPGRSGSACARGTCDNAGRGRVRRRAARRDRRSQLLGHRPVAGAVCHRAVRLERPLQ